MHAVSRATITISSATRAIRDSARIMAKAFLNPGRRQAVIQPDDPWGFEETPVETWSDLLRRRRTDLALLAAFLLLAYVSFHRKSVPPEVRRRSWCRSPTWGSRRATSSRSPTSSASLDGSLADLPAQPGLVPVRRVHGGVDGAVGPLLLRPRVRLRRLHAAHGRGAARRRGASTCRRRSRSAPGWIKFGLLGGRARLLPGDAQHDGLPLRRAVLDVRALRVVGAAVGGARARCSSPRSSCATCTAASCARVGATLGVISLLTVFKIKRWSECTTCRICEKTCEWGAIDGPAHHPDRVRALRRLRARLRRRGEVPALAHPRLQEAQGRR